MPAFLAPINNREVSTEDLIKQSSILALVANPLEELKDVSDSNELRYLCGDWKPWILKY